MNQKFDECSITVAICTRNRAEALSKAIASLLPQIDSQTEFLIVDNASTDSTPEVIARFAKENPEICCLREDTPGAAIARNTALAKARGKYVIFFDDDELAEPGWLTAYQEFLKQFSSERLGSVGGPYIAQYEAAPPSWLPPHYGSFSLGEEKRLLTGPVGPAGGNCAYLKEAVVKVGGFDPDLIRHEDSEISLRLRGAGYDVWWLPEARVRHVIPASRCQVGTQMRLWFAEGKAAALVRWRSRKTATGRLGFIISRSFVAPIQSLLQVIAALLFLLIWNRRQSIRLIFRAARNLGMFAQILTLHQLKK